MRLALPATLLAFLFLLDVAAAQTAQPTAAPVLLASSAPAARARQASARLFSRVEVGITAAWPAAPTEYADYAAHEIEAGTVAGDLYVRWAAFGPHAARFAVDVSLGGRPFVTVATVAAGRPSAEAGVHVVGLAPGLYEVRVRETGANGVETVSTPVRVRV